MADRSAALSCSSDGVLAASSKLASSGVAEARPADVKSEKAADVAVSAVALGTLLTSLARGQMQLHAFALRADAEKLLNRLGRG